MFKDNVYVTLENLMDFDLISIQKDMEMDRLVLIAIMEV